MPSMKRERAEFKKELYNNGYNIEKVMGNEFILNKDNTRLAVELKRGETLKETMARTQHNYEVMIRMDRQVEEYKRLRRLFGEKHR